MSDCVASSIVLSQARSTVFRVLARQRIMKLLQSIRRRRFTLPTPPRASGKLNVLMVTSEKKNQLFYKDAELARLTNAVRLFEHFPYEHYDWDMRRIVDAIYGDDHPDVIYIHYANEYHRLRHLNALNIPKLGFVGDPQDFVDDDAKHVVKRRWMSAAGINAYFTIAPQANWMVWQGLQTTAAELPIINCHLAVDSHLFYDMRLRRTRDIAVFGAFTDEYPFRNQVREYLRRQTTLRTNRRRRVRRGSSYHAEAFARELNRYKASFTCASIHGYTMAKYFEIPACGTLLFGERTPLLSEFGYVDGGNFVEVSSENFVEKFEHYLLGVHPDDRLAIAASGQRLVHDRHTWAHRMPTVVNDIKAWLDSAHTLPRGC